MKRFKSTKGFTLVELIVVIAIIAVLSAIAVPAYKGYIEKANRSADLQLLSAVNTAFVSACIENGVSNIGLEGDVKLEGTTTIEGVIGVAQEISDSFDRYFTDKDVELVYYKNASTDFLYNRSVGSFLTDDMGETETYTWTDANGNTYSLTFAKEDIETIKGSNLEEVGVDNLLKQIDAITQLASGFMNTGDGKGNKLVESILSSQEYLDFAAEKIGGTLSADEFKAALIVTGKIPADEETKTWAQKLYGTVMQDPDKKAVVENLGTNLDKTLSNSLVLFAAGQSSEFNNDDFRNSLKELQISGTQLNENGVAESSDDLIQLGLNAYNQINATENSVDPGKAMAQAAYGYSMSISYGNYIKQPGNENVSWSDYLDSPQGKKDFNAYASCMGMINNNATNQDVTTGLLQNGFSDQGLIDAIGDALQ